MRGKGSQLPCIYHQVPKDMVGTELRPLNQLKTLTPHVYRREIAKYQDHPSRQKLPETRLPELGCLWNDVIHCSPIHPHLLYEEWLRHLDTVDPDLRFFVIPIASVSHLPLGAMQPVSIGETRDVNMIDAYQYSEVSIVPEETRAWYAKLASKGRFGAHFVGVPHVLVHGTIDTSDLQVIRWGDPVTG